MGVNRCTNPDGCRCMIFDGRQWAFPDDKACGWCSGADGRDIELTEALETLRVELGEVLLKTAPVRWTVQGLEWIMAQGQNARRHWKSVKEFWSGRPYYGEGKDGKRRTHRHERRCLKWLLQKEHEDDQADSIEEAMALEEHMRDGGP